MARAFDAIIIGAGHNGLVTAAYLARAGRQVLVLERRDLVGGACVTEEVWPGFKVSTAAYVNSLLRPEIIRDLELKRHGFEMLPRNPSSFTPFPGRPLPDARPRRRDDRREVAKFSARDAEALPQYEADAASASPTSSSRCSRRRRPTRGRGDRATCGAWASSAGGSASLGTDGREAVEILTGAARPILDRWFESEQLKATLATDAVIGAFASPSMPGTAYVLFHHVMGECNGVRGVWGYVRGGMGGICRGAGRRRRRQHGAEIRTQCRRGTHPRRATARCSAWRWPTAPRFDARVVASQRRRQRHLPEADRPERPAGRLRRGA